MSTNLSTPTSSNKENSQLLQNQNEVPTTPVSSKKHIPSTLSPHHQQPSLSSHLSPQNSPRNHRSPRRISMRVVDPNESEEVNWLLNLCDPNVSDMNDPLY